MSGVWRAARHGVKYRTGCNGYVFDHSATISGQALKRDYRRERAGQVILGYATL
jgi:hypothetical protein